MTDKASRLTLFLATCGGAHPIVIKRAYCEANSFAGIGVGIILITILGGLSGGYALFTVFEDIVLSCVGGSLYGFALGFLDRSIIASIRKKSKQSQQVSDWENSPALTYGVAFVKILLSAMISLIVATPLQLKLFEDSILVELDQIGQEKINSFRKEIDTEYSRELTKLEKEKDTYQKEVISPKQKELEKLNASYRAEISSGQGGRVRGEGPVALVLRRQIDQINKEIEQDKENSNFKAVIARIQEINTEKNNRINNQKNKLDNASGIASQLSALQNLIDQEKKVVLGMGNYALAWFGITLFFIALDGTTITLKLLSPRSKYDEMLEEFEEEVSKNDKKERKLREERAKDSINLKTQRHKNRVKKDQNEVNYRKTKNNQKNKFREKTLTHELDLQERALDKLIAYEENKYHQLLDPNSLSLGDKEYNELHSLATSGFEEKQEDKTLKIRRPGPQIFLPNLHISLPNIAALKSKLDFWERLRLRNKILLIIFVLFPASILFIFSGYLMYEVILVLREHNVKYIPYPSNINSLVFKDRNGEKVEDRLGHALFSDKEVEEFSQNLRKTLIYIEDRRFHEYTHIDPKSTARAIINTAMSVVTSRGSEGGSNLAEQLVKNTFLKREHNTIQLKLNNNIVENTNLEREIFCLEIEIKKKKGNQSQIKDYENKCQDFDTQAISVSQLETALVVKENQLGSVGEKLALNREYIRYYIRKSYYSLWNIRRKFRQFVLAINLYNYHSREEILKAYLNRIEIGLEYYENLRKPSEADAYIYGFEEASQRYFGQPASDLDISQSAFLVSILNRPNDLVVNQVINNSESCQMAFGENIRECLLSPKKERDKIISVLLKDGKISNEEAEQALSEEIKLNLDYKRSPIWNEYPNTASDYQRIVIKETKDILSRLGKNPNNHYFIDTTLDLEKQRIAQKNLDQHIEAKGLPNDDYKYASIVTLDANDGAVLVLVDGTQAYDLGGDIPSGRYYSSVLLSRRLASTFKLFPFSLAVEHPDYQQELNCQEQSISSSICQSSSYLKDAFATSDNDVAQELVQMVGAQQVANLAYESGIKGNYSRFAKSLNLWSDEQSIPIELDKLQYGAVKSNLLNITAAYSHLYNGGNVNVPYSVVRIYDPLTCEDVNIWDTCTVIYDRTKRRSSVSKLPLQPGTPKKVLQLLGQVVSHREGTARLLRSDYDFAGKGYEISGKTGSTTGARDFWFIGGALRNSSSQSSEKLVTGVWIGSCIEEVNGVKNPYSNDNQCLMSKDYLTSEEAVSLWGNYMYQSLSSAE